MTLLLLILAAFVLLAVVGAMVVVYMQGRRVGERSDLSSEAPRPAPAALTGEIEADTRALLARGRKIEAVKLVRDHSGLGLREAKEYVDAVESGLSPAPPARAAELPPAEPADMDALEVEALELLAEGRAIEAIKLVRQRTGLGLKEAKDYVDALGARE